MLCSVVLNMSWQNTRVLIWFFFYINSRTFICLLGEKRKQEAALNVVVFACLRMASVDSFGIFSLNCILSETNIWSVLSFYWWQFCFYWYFKHACRVFSLRGWVAHRRRALSLVFNPARDFTLSRGAKLTLWLALHSSMVFLCHARCYVLCYFVSLFWTLLAS